MHADFFLNGLLSYFNPLSENYLLGNVDTSFTNLFTYFNPSHNNFILKNVITSLGNVINYLNPLHSNFFGLKIIDLLGSLLQSLFVPSSDYYSNKINSLKTALNNKIPYQDYIDELEDIGEASGSNQNGIATSIDLNNYRLADRVTISLSNFIDFSIFNQYRNTWFTWVRVVVYILLVIYNINEIMKFFRGFHLAGGSSAYVSDNLQKGEN